MAYSNTFGDSRLPPNFWAKAQPQASGCWEWTGAKDTHGYGRFRFDDKLQCAHRLIYEVLIGPIPTGLESDHLCRNRACINPWHLEPVTHRENILRGVGPIVHNSRKTHCPQGHPYNRENTYIWPKRHKRSCRTCNREDNLRRYRRQKALVA